MDPKTISMNATLSFLGGLLLLILNRKWDSIKKKYLSCLVIEENMKKLRKLMEKLKTEEEVFSARMIEAEEIEGKIGIAVVKNWISRAKQLIFDEYQNLESEYSQWSDGSSEANLSRRIRIRYELSKKIVDMLDDAKSLLDQVPPRDASVATKQVPQAIPEIPTSITDSRSITTSLNEVLHHVADDQVHIIGIWGMGGVGKTALLRKLETYLNLRRPRLFDLVIFTVISRSCTTEEDLKKKLARAFGMTLEAFENITNFTRGKKILLLLDDLWRYADLPSIGIQIGNTIGCKVVLTTCSASVCAHMKANRTIKVECLDKEEAWNLFVKNVGEEIISSDARIPQVAEAIASECCGLRLALITIGRTMSIKETWEEWQAALAWIQNSQFHYIPDFDESMFPVLELSYISLQISMRECFLSCALWPEDHDIEIHQLIDCWVGLGLLQESDGMNAIFYKGLSVIKGLKNMCLLQQGIDKDHVKLHDVLRDMALWIASEHGKKETKWIVRAQVGLKECRIGNWQVPERISLMYNDIKGLPSNQSECQNLFLLMLQENPSLQSIPKGFLGCMPSLTYLDLSSTSISKVPPDVSNLINLQFLNLSSTNITSLPAELDKLVKLKYLILRLTSINKINGLLSNLKALQLLDLSYCYEPWDDECYGGPEELERLGEKLTGLKITVQSVSVLERVSKLLLASVLAITIQQLDDIHSFQLFSSTLADLGSNALQSLMQLVIRWCNVLEELRVESAAAVNFKQLEHLVLLELERLQNISWNGIAPKEVFVGLHSLEIIKCDRLRNISWVAQLPSLDYLYIANCDAIEVIIGSDNGTEEIAEVADDSVVILPKLKNLELSQLPNLQSICRSSQGFNSLKYLVVYLCPFLKDLPFGQDRIPSELQEIKGDSEWWKGLEEETRAPLQEFFRERNP